MVGLSRNQILSAQRADVESRDASPHHQSLALPRDRDLVRHDLVRRVRPGRGTKQEACPPA